MLIILIAIFFVIVGILVKYGRMHFLIAGYNLMSPQEKAKYDIEGIASVFRNGFIAMALLIVLIPLIRLGLDESMMEFIGIMASVLIGTTYILIRVNSKKFKVESKHQH